MYILPLPSFKVKDSEDESDLKFINLLPNQIGGGVTGGVTSGGVDCLSLINNFRRSKGLSALTAASASQQTCANTSATNDASRGYHNSMGRCGERAQCECMKGVGGVGSGIAGCINAYIGEGPGGGHYNIISGNYSSVACGTNGDGFFTQNFY